MKPKLIALNLALAAALCGIVWEARARWNEAQALSRATVNVPVKPAPVPPLVPVPVPEGPTAVKYEDVARKNLFSPDRNPDIVVAPPPVEVPKPMPPLPTATGVMNLPSGVKAFMSDKPGQAYRMVKVDDKIGDFKILELTSQSVTFGWEGKQIKRNIEDLIDRSSEASSGPAVPSAVPAGAAAALGGQRVAAVAGPNDVPGKEMSPGVRSCANNDTSPSGTIQGGYKKFVEQSPFGPICRWVKQ